jgi:phosphate transport system permease protein
MNYSYNYRLRKIKNILFHIVLIISSIAVLSPLFFIFAYLFKMGSSSLSFDFFTKVPMPVGETGGGMLHAISGSFMIVALGAVLAIPPGIAAGVYLSEFKDRRLASYLRYSTDLLTGIPSIVIGIFAYIIVVLPFKSFSALGGSFALAIIILPIVIKSTEEILKLVPTIIREAGLALGLPRWKVIYYIVVKGNASSLITGVILGISRAAGETAPLIFTSFGSMYLSFNYLEPMASLPVQIYTYAVSPYEEWHRLAWAGAFILICIVLGLNIFARILFSRTAIMNTWRNRRKKLR